MIMDGHEAKQTPLDELVARALEKMASGEWRLVLDHPDPSQGASYCGTEVPKEIARRAARSTVPEAGKAAVKPLEWRFFDVKHEYGRGVWDANHSYGTFTIQDCVEKYEGDNRFYVYHLSASFATLEAAQEAVYRQYEQRIISALVSVPAPSGALQAKKVQHRVRQG